MVKMQMVINGVLNELHGWIDAFERHVIEQLRDVQSPILHGLEKEGAQLKSKITSLAPLCPSIFILSYVYVGGSSYYCGSFC